LVKLPHKILKIKKFMERIIIYPLLAWYAFEVFEPFIPNYIWYIDLVKALPYTI
jgi:hypothetical protein